MFQWNLNKGICFLHLSTECYTQQFAATSCPFYRAEQRDYVLLCVVFNHNYVVNVFLCCSDRREHTEQASEPVSLVVLAQHSNYLSRVINISRDSPPPLDHRSSSRVDSFHLQNLKKNNLKI